MQRLLMLINALLATAALAQTSVTAIDSTEVAPNVHVLVGVDGFAGGNMTLLTGGEQIVLVDDGLEVVKRLIVDKARELAGGNIDFIINTHVHGDHAGSNAAFAENGSVIITHDNIRRRLVEDASPAGGPGGLPVITFNDTITFYINDDEAYVFHVETAHTDGDAAILLRNANVLMTGDVLFHRLFPFIDLDSGGDVDGNIAAMQKMLGMIDVETIVIPGHGEVTDKAGMQADLNMLVDARARIKALLDEGMSGEEILAANPLADYDADFNWRFITTARMTETLVRYLSGSE